jgi:hypothetical protein
LDYTHDSGLKGGSRFYLSYSGSAPTGANCTTLAGTVATAWAGDLAGVVNTDWTLSEVDVLDIATHSGASGQWSGSHPGTVSGTPMPAQTAANVEYGIARRYRGGKPRMYLPPGVTGNAENDTQWTTAYVGNFQTGVSNLIIDIGTTGPGAMGTLAHVNVSYYQGFTNITNTSGRTRAAPKYRDTALVDAVTGYFGKQEISSQRRRRVSTTY